MTSSPNDGFLMGAPLELPAIPVRDLDLPTRAKNALIGGGINTLADMMQWRVCELLTLPHCGPATIEALRRVAAELTGTRKATSRRVSVRWRRGGAASHAGEAGRQHAR
jgi:DNA-directed RNA polymerase alpha subunit